MWPGNLPQSKAITGLDSPGPRLPEKAIHSVNLLNLLRHGKSGSCEGTSPTRPQPHGVRVPFPSTQRAGDTAAALRPG